MRREWQPGDVALYDGMAGLVVREDQTDDRLTLVYADKGGDMCSAWVPSDARPLVVIDPEDREQVGRLTAAVTGQMYGDEYVTNGDIQAALRELANPTPPKPEEPMGFAAVVEDADGDRWVSYREGGAEWVEPWHRADRDAWADYDRIAVVRVLSEGVQ